MDTIRRTAALAAAAMLATALTACGNDDTTTAAADSEPAETEAASEPVNYAFGDTAVITGMEVTVSAPEPEDISGYDMPELEGVSVTVSVTNTGDVPLEPAGDMGVTAFSGTAAAEGLMCESDTLPPGKLQPGRTAEWPECFGVEDASDVIVDMYPMHGEDSITFGAGS